MSVPTLMRIVSASVSVANKAGSIVKGVLSRGNLGIIDKVMSTLMILFIIFL